ncbi:HipA family kinase [Endozoicomonas numazuensis]|uniref:HipA family kinase n=1 Tax=Endozoicomonas numazuensis TaxID=1137799 RepID=UPI00068AC0A7|nr:HipA family kinase [Endozoicomonas numazuensis]
MVNVGWKLDKLLLISLDVDIKNKNNKPTVSLYSGITDKGAILLNQLVQIEEVLEELEQGYSGVFRCVGQDGLQYYVKGHNVGREDQAKEWIAAQLAKEFGLPIANFALAEVDEYMHEYLSPSLKKIGHGLCFASQEVKMAQWPEPHVIAQRVNPELQNDVLFFDYWIRNQDRTKGNPNLLWVPHDEELFVIDHNLAFDPKFNKDDFLNYHIFSEARNRLFGDMFIQEQYQSRLDKALESFQPAIKTISEAWQWHDLEETRPFKLDSDALLSILEEYKKPEFWSMK